MRTILSKHILAFSMAVVCALSCAISLKAQETKDGNDKQEVIDIPSHLIMDLYRTPDKDAYPVNRWYKGISVMGYWNPDLLWDQAQYKTNLTSFGVALQKDFSKSHALRIGFNYSSAQYDNGLYDPNVQDYQMKRYALSLDYLWNLTNYYGGYDRTRRFNLSLATGITAGLAQADENLEIVEGLTGTTMFDQKYEREILLGERGFVGFHIGPHFQYAISPRISLFAEPRLSIYSDGYDMGSNFHDVDLGGSLLAGMAFSLTGPYTNMKDTSNLNAGFFDNLFVQLYGGLNNTSDVNALGMGQVKTPGLNFGFNVGKWFNKPLGIQLGMFESVMAYGLEPNGITKRFMQLHGGRAEILVNPVYLLSDEVSLRRFGLTMSIGLEAGEMKKHRGETTADYFVKNYIGLTTAAQFRYFLNKNIAFFFEGRVSMPKYDIEEGDPYGVAPGSFKDQILAANAGIEFYNSRFARYSRFRKGDNRQSSSIVSPQDKTWFISGMLGLGHPVHAGELFTKFIDPSVSLAVGNVIDPYSTVRLHAGITLLRNAELRGSKHSFLNQVGLDYLFNVTNLWMGVDPTRHWDLRLLAGPVVQLYNLGNLSKLETGFGAEFGAQVAKKINSNWELFVEPRYQILDETHPNRWNVYGGLTYLFDYDYEFEQDPTKGMHEYYLQLLSGAQFGLLRRTGNRFEDWTRWGSFDFVLGRRVNPLFSAQAAIFSNRLNLDGNLETEYFGGRLEGVFNIFRTFSENNFDSRFNWTLAAGIEGGRLVDANLVKRRPKYKNFGLTAATQLQYRVADRTWLLAQLRAQQVNALGVRLPLSAQLGLQYDLVDKKTNEHTDHANVYLQGGMGIFNIDALAAEAGLGWNINPRHEVRLSAIAAFKGLHTTRDPYTYQWLSLAPNYLFNLSNAVLGEDDARVIDLKLVAGLDFTMHGLKNVFRFGKLDKIFHTDTYLGFNFGTQVAARLSDGLSFYLEPRFSLQPYDPYLGANNHTALNLFTQAGLRLDLNSKRQLNAPDATKLGREKSFLQFNAVLQPIYITKSQGLNTGTHGHGLELVYGSWWNNTIGGQGALVLNSFQKYSYLSTAGVRPELMVDVTSALNPDWTGARFSTVISGGLEIGNVHRRDENYFLASPTAALQFRYRMPSDYLSLVMGTRAYAYMMKAKGKLKRECFVPMSFHVGMQYNINATSTPGAQRQYANKEKREDSYLQIAYRFQPALLQKTGLDLKRYMGNGVEVTYGHWRGNVWGVQLGAFYDSYRWECKEPINTFGVRPELTLDVLGALNPEVVGKRFSLVASAGVELGNVEFDRLDYSKFGVAPTVGAQLRYRLNSIPVSLVAGGRISALKTNEADSFSKNRSYPVSGEIGLQWNIFK